MHHNCSMVQGQAISAKARLILSPREDMSEIANMFLFTTIQFYFYLMTVSLVEMISKPRVDCNPYTDTRFVVSEC